MNYDLIQPCKDCPFRKGTRTLLHPERAKEIVKAITVKDGTFTCHKTLGKKEDDQQHCAGAMIMLEHIQRPNQMMRIMERLGYYDMTKLKMDSDVFETPAAFIAYHREHSRK